MGEMASTWRRPPMASEKEKAETRAKEWTAQMFGNDAGEADRLVLTQDNPHRDLGGWCRSAFERYVLALILTVQEEGQHKADIAIVAAVEAGRSERDAEVKRLLDEAEDWDDPSMTWGEAMCELKRRLGLSEGE
jgi:hypothetical protein